MKTMQHWVVVGCAFVLAIGWATREASGRDADVQVWGGLHWGDAFDVVKFRYPGAEERNDKDGSRSLVLRNREAVPGVIVSDVWLTFRSNRLFSVDIEGDLTGNAFVSAVVTKYGRTDDVEKRDVPFSGTETTFIWRGRKGDSLRIRMFDKSSSVYLEYESPAAAKESEREAAHQQNTEWGGVGGGGSSTRGQASPSAQQAVATPIRLSRYTLCTSSEWTTRADAIEDYCANHQAGTAATLCRVVGQFRGCTASAIVPNNPKKPLEGDAFISEHDNVGWVISFAKASGKLIVSSVQHRALDESHSATWAPGETVAPPAEQLSPDDELVYSIRSMKAVADAGWSGCYLVGRWSSSRPSEARRKTLASSRC